MPHTAKPDPERQRPAASRPGVVASGRASRPARSPSLDPRETNDDLSSTPAEAGRVMQALEESGIPKLQRQAARCRQCCQLPCIVRTADGRPKAIWGYCRSRACALCQKIRGLKIRKKVVEAIQKAHRPRFLTLTLQHTDEPLGEQIDRLFASYRRLRQQALWKKTTFGAIAVMEIERNTTTGQWHPHLHIVTDGVFVHQSKWVTAWQKASRGSFIVHIRKIDSIDGAAHYVAKYTSKPAKMNGWPPEVIAEFYDGLGSRRLNNSCGTLKLPGKKDDAVCSKVDPGCNWPAPESMRQMLRIGMPKARELFEKSRALGGSIHAIMSGGDWLRAMEPGPQRDAAEIAFSAAYDAARAEMRQHYGLPDEDKPVQREKAENPQIQRLFDDARPPTDRHGIPD